MSGVRLLRAADRRAQPWKNGGGETSEVAVFPEGAGMDDFDWRVSIASVAIPGPFSLFPGVDRVLTLIEGRLRLAFDGEALDAHLSPEDPPLSFPGDVDVVGTPVGGTASDVNLMTRRGLYKGAVERLVPPYRAPLVIHAPTSIVIARGHARLRLREKVFSIAPLDALGIEDVTCESLLVDSDQELFIISLSALSGVDERLPRGQSKKVP